MSEYKILIVDDEPDISNLLEKTLKMEGFHKILKAGTGEQAVKNRKAAVSDWLLQNRL